jgi:hypothetical protein
MRHAGPVVVMVLLALVAAAPAALLREFAAGMNNHLGETLWNDNALHRALTELVEVEVEGQVEVVAFPATRAWGHRPLRVFFDKAVSKIKLIRNFVPKKGVMKQARCY